MLQAETHVKPPYIKDLFTKFNMAIEEARIVRKTIALSDHLRHIENRPEQAMVTSYIRLEIADLESQLMDIREKILD